MELVERSDQVVGQDKCSAVQYRARTGFWRFSYDLPHRHRTVRTVPCETVRTVAHRAGPQARWQLAKRLIGTLGAVLGAAAGLVLTGHLFQLRITLTDSSAPAGIYRLITAPAARGAVVAACLPAAIARVGRARGYLSGGACPADAEPVAKVIGALPGDVVKVAPEGVTVNGVRFSNSRTAMRDSAGRPLEHVGWGVHPVSVGQVWLFGFHDARSWDARYFGPIAASSVQGELRPVLTW
jgi:conjugative transfer signal peptidase TraF